MIENIKDITGKLTMLLALFVSFLKIQSFL